MNLLSAENISRKLGERTLFENITLGINKGDKAALIAPNGTGKTSLFKILAGLDSPDSGLVVTANGLRVGLLEQDPYIDPNASIMDNVFDTSTETGRAVAEYENAMLSGDPEAIQVAMEKVDSLNAWDFESRAGQILHQLKIIDLGQEAGQLSGGQKRRIALAKLLLTDADLFLLDEPTNHLDIDMIEWLEKYLTASSSSLLMVTHDRYFLDKVCNKIWEMDEGKIFKYQGNYSYFLEKREERYAMMEAGISKAKNLFGKELEWIRKQPKARTTKSKARIEAFDDLSAKANQKIADRQLQFVNKMSRLGNKVIEAHQIAASFDRRGTLFNNFSYKFLPGERVGIVGENGCGKSTLVKIFTGIIPPTQGRVEIGETVVFGYFGQDGLQFKPGQRIIELIKDIAEQFETQQGGTLHATQLLEKFMFPRNTHYTPIEKLSGGEKRRLYLLTVLIKKPNVLILDEPTNDLDILTLNVLEEYLDTFAGTVILISHDRYFMDKIVDHVFVFEQGKPIKDFPGNYSLYKAFKELQESPSEIEKTKIEQKTSSSSQTDEKRKLNFKEKLEYEQLEKEIKTIEKDIAEITVKLNNPELSHEDLRIKGIKLQELQNRMEECELRWLELSEWI